MANIIKPKRSNTAGLVPTTGNLTSGELGVNMADKKVYINNGTAVVQVGAGNLSGLGDTNITTPSNGQSLAYDSASGKWINSNAGAGDVVGAASSTDNAIVRFDGTSGKNIQNSTVTIDDTGNFDNVNAIGFDTTPGTLPTAAGSMFWDTGNGSPSVVLNANTTLQLGQENIALVYNGTGSTITNGSVVAVVGAQGQRPSVALADADSESLSSGTLGIATENIANGAEGYVCTFGLVRGLDTSGFTAGQPIWLSQTAGQFTATRPDAPANTVFLGWVIKVNASSGEIFVNISNGWELDELHNVLIQSPTIGQTLLYDPASSVWRNGDINVGNGLSITKTGSYLDISNTGVVEIQGTANQITASASTGFVTLSIPSTFSEFAAGTKLLFQQTTAPTGWTKITTSDNAALRVVSGSVTTGGTVDFTTAFASQTPSGTISSTTATNQATTAGGTIANTTAGGTVGATTLTTAQIPAHGHTFSGNTGTISADHTHFDSGHTHTYATVTGSGSIYAAQPGFSLGTFNSGAGYAALGGVSANHVHAYSGTTANAGSGGSHDHTFTGTAHNHTFSGSSHNHTQDAHNHTFSGSAINLAVKYVDVIIASKD